MKQYRQNGPIHRAWVLYPTTRHGETGWAFRLLAEQRFYFLPAGSSAVFGPTTPLYAWDTDAGTSIGGGTKVMDMVVTPWVIFTVLGSGAFFFISEDLHDTVLDPVSGPDYADIFWVINGRVEDRQP
jgi:hypothetical protein